MKQRPLFRWLVMFVFLIFTILIWLWPKNDHTSQKAAPLSKDEATSAMNHRQANPDPRITGGASPLQHPASDARNEQRLNEAFSNPINFFGQVVDQNGIPVEGAQVRFSVPSNIFELGNGTKDGPLSDATGRFSITGQIGAGITVSVSHPDYYKTERSSVQVSYFERSNKIPTPANPVVLLLRKKGEAEPLLKIKQVLRNVPKNGQAVRVGLRDENVHDIVVQAWTAARPEGSARNSPFDWKVRLEVTGGGLLAYEDQYEFEAPENGYVPFFEFSMPSAGINGKWRDEFEQSFFVKLSNGNYARMRFQMIAGANHFAVVESYYNPSGSRNLEYDPEKALPSNH